ncbi:hypothetical protein E2562_002078 [Oryza meyeriana var. granulata]|uniref:Uncharacterized protein n=1 Tax=Oryza meyeriana var. granulata TaxID=110450 RepID=A0A6G1EDG9_9ORYZ|nr:hypothetical protein E2562_002078 [Oryza meyeriana var. granulata]
MADGTRGEAASLRSPSATAAKGRRPSGSSHVGLMYNASMTFKICREQGLKDCQYVAFSYRFDGVGRWYTKGVLFNGYTSANFTRNIYLKVPLDFDATSPLVSAAGLTCSLNVSVETVSAEVYGMAPRNSGKWTYFFVFAGVLGVLDLLFVVTGWWFLSSKQSIPSSLEAGYRMVVTSQFRRFTYSELKDATANFKEELGRAAAPAWCTAACSLAVRWWR